MPSRLSVLAAGLLVAGCANARVAHGTSSPAGIVPARSPAPSATPIPVILYARQLRFDRPTGGFMSPRRWKGAAAKQLERAVSHFPSLRLASQMEIESGISSPRLLIEATQATAGSKQWSTVSSMTKYLVPSTEDSEVELSARLMDGDTIVQPFTASGAYTTKKHLLLLAAPWMWRLGVPGAVTQETFRELLRQVQPEAVRSAAHGTSSPAGIVPARSVTP